MSGFVGWIGAESEKDLKPTSSSFGSPKANPGFDDRGTGDARGKGFPGHNGPGWAQVTACPENALERTGDLCLYRDRTVALLRRFMRISLETGRFPSIVGREFFRAKVSYYRAATFEDRVIFVRDVEKCLERLGYWDQQLIVRVILQEHSREQAAYLLHCSRKTIARRLPEVLDTLSKEFLANRLLTQLPERERDQQ